MKKTNKQTKDKTKNNQTTENVSNAQFRDQYFAEKTNVIGI